MSIKVLIADDHAVFRSGLRALLEKTNEFEVVGEAGTGIDTLNMVDELKVDVLVLDISMPGLSGTGVAQEVLRTHPTLPIVILTMHEDKFYLQELLRIGVCGYVLKKSSGAEVIQAIKAVCRGDNYIDSALIKHVLVPSVGNSAPRKNGRLGLLTSREQEVCRLLAYGYTNTEVAQALFISDRTVESHRTSIMSKLGLKSRANLVAFAIENGIMKLD